MFALVLDWMEQIRLRAFDDQKEQLELFVEKGQRGG